MNIGGVSIPSRVALAPMAGVTDLAFRTVCRSLGAGLTYTEMVSAKALCYGDKKTRTLMELGASEHPAAVQIFGSDPVCMQEAAAIVSETTAADFIDINMGCPVPKITGSGDGAALMRDPDKAAEVAAAVLRGTKRPVTAKLRLGWDRGSLNCVQVASYLEEAGVSAVAIHGRTKVQGYSGCANWDLIRAVKDALSIPVIANGDITSGQDALRILRYTRADMAMVGRASFGNPWIFQEASAILEGRSPPPLPSLSERCDQAVLQVALAIGQKGETIACLEARRHYAYYLHGVPYAKYWRGEISHIKTFEDIRRITQGIKRELE